MLIGLGFKPLPAAGLALIGNTAPVAYGALGTPIIALSAVTGFDTLTLSAAVGRQLPLFSVLVPFWLVAVMGGRRGMLEVWPACLTAGLSFAVAQFLVSNYHGPWIVDIAGSLFSMLSLVVLLRFWQPATVWNFLEDRNGDNTAAAAGVTAPVKPTRRQALIAWMPWILLSVFVFLWGLPQVKEFLNNLSVIKFPVPFLDKAVLRNVPVVPAPEAEPAVFPFKWLSATGTRLLLAGSTAGSPSAYVPSSCCKSSWGHLKRTRLSLLTVAVMLALGYTTRYGD